MTFFPYIFKRSGSPSILANVRTYTTRFFCNQRKITSLNYKNSRVLKSLNYNSSRFSSPVFNSRTSSFMNFFTPSRNFLKHGLKFGSPGVYRDGLFVFWKLFSHPVHVCFLSGNVIAVATFCTISARRGGLVAGSEPFIDSFPEHVVLEQPQSRPRSITPTDIGNTPQTTTNIGSENEGLESRELTPEQMVDAFIGEKIDQPDETIDNHIPETTQKLETRLSLGLKYNLFELIYEYYTYNELMKERQLQSTSDNSTANTINDNNNNDNNNNNNYSPQQEQKLPELSPLAMYHIWNTDRLSRYEKHDINKRLQQLAYSLGFNRVINTETQSYMPEHMDQSANFQMYPDELKTVCNVILGNELVRLEDFKKIYRSTNDLRLKQLFGRWYCDNYMKFKCQKTQNNEPFYRELIMDSVGSKKLFERYLSILQDDQSCGFFYKYNWKHTISFKTFLVVFEKCLDLDVSNDILIKLVQCVTNSSGVHHSKVSKRPEIFVDVRTLFGIKPDDLGMGNHSVNRAPIISLIENNDKDIDAVKQIRTQIQNNKKFNNLLKRLRNATTTTTTTTTTATTTTSNIKK